MQKMHSCTAALGVVGANRMPHLHRMEAVEPIRVLKRLPEDPKGKTMNAVIAHLKDAAVKHALYRKTRDEIAQMPLDVALDLNIYPGDAARIAYEAVYGQAA
jgi:hypothetical protein